MKKISLIHSTLILAAYLLRWQLLQCSAWAVMLVRYTSQSGLVDGWQRTFSGDYPCAICQAVATGSQREAAVILFLQEHPSLLLAPLLAIAFASFIRLHITRTA